MHDEFNRVGPTILLLNVLKISVFYVVFAQIDWSLLLILPASDFSFMVWCKKSEYVAQKLIGKIKQKAKKN